VELQLQTVSQMKESFESLSELVQIESQFELKYHLKMDV